jgi:alkylation response protein AidB-like acyl-CoA dehydrogenase
VSDLRFKPCELPDDLERVRAEVRSFLREMLGDRPAARRAPSWTGFDPAFSRACGARGYIGMTWPREFGGGAQSALARYVVAEEMLAAGAPVNAHWPGDRQTGPLLLRYGTEAQKRRFLPALARSEIFFCVALSEPDVGSDLASIRSRASPVDGGWLLRGRKIWTSNAHRAHFMMGLFRTSWTPERKHDGLTQMIVDMASPGLEVRPIRDMTDARHFNEVTFQDVFVPHDQVVGAVGSGWSQILDELAYERSGPERYLSAYLALPALLREVDARDPGVQMAVGRLVASLAVLRRMSVSVAGMLAADETPNLQAALVKDLGTTLEQDMPNVCATLLNAEPSPESGSDCAQALAYLLRAAPSFSLRGGTREILRGIIARGLGLR